MSTSSHSLAAVRAADLLVLNLDLYNLVPDGAVLRRQDPAEPARVVLRFPSQHLLEEAFYEGWPVGFADSFGAAPSRVAFAVPDEIDEVPATLEALLEFLAGCSLSVVGTADQLTSGGIDLWPRGLLDLVLGGGSRRGEKGEGRGHSLTEPALDQTAIELPYRLILSPRSRSGFAHAATPPSLAGLDRVELWHSRLGLAPLHEGTPGDRAKRTVRAVWVRSLREGEDWDPTDAFNPPPEADLPFLAALNDTKRHEIAHLTSNYWQRKLDVRPVEVERLALSALGGWLDATGHWEQQPGTGLSLQEWENRTTQGRDHFVKVVDSGYLYPFGHRASLVKITERKWEEGVAGRPAALRQRKFVIVREPELRYGPAEVGPLPRQMPLKRVRLKTLVTPVISQPASDRLFRIAVDGQPFRFAIEGEDGEGNLAWFAMPLVFVNPPSGTVDVGKASEALRGGSDEHRTDLGGSIVELVPRGEAAPGAAAKPPETSFPVGSAAFDGAPGGGLEAGFHPKLVDAGISLPAVGAVTGRAAAEKFEYATPYIDHGFGPGNAGEVFAKLPKPPQLGLSGAAREAGGLLAPKIAIGGLSRKVGPLGGADLAKLANDDFDPAKFFAGALGGAKLFGLFSLDAVIQRVLGPLDAPGSAPQLLSRKLADGRLVAEWDYSPTLQPFPTPEDPNETPRDKVAAFAPNPNGGGLRLHAEIAAHGQEPKPKVECTLSKVDLRLPPGENRCIEIPVERIHLLAVAGSKLDVDVVLGAIRFAGPLEFVNELRQLIPADGFSDPPALEVTPEGVSSGFSVALPDVAIGMFALQHVSLGARFELPFIGPPPSFSFNFCTRNEPFLLTVSAFGGGGFFLVKLDPEGMQRLEASLEFGASVSINFGVASGGVHVMAGIYFVLETSGAKLTGYFRAGGNVSVLGIVSISIELYLGLEYDIGSGKAIGRASLTVEVELCLFSTSVQISCERKLAGSSGDPPLTDLLSPYKDPDDKSSSPRIVDPWADYCRAYA